MMLNFKQRYQEKEQNLGFSLENELAKHAWFPNISASEAEDLLAHKPTYTYLIRPYEVNGKIVGEGKDFAISFVQPDGSVKHDHFKIVDYKYGIWRNFAISHIGRIEKVLRDMMHCSFEEGQPLV